MAYFDNAATTYPKPEIVYEFMNSFYKSCGANAGRGNYSMSQSAGEMISDTRTRIKKLFKCKSKNVVFTPTATIALNIVLQGLIRDGKRTVYLSPFEHNAVTRIMHNYESSGNIKTHMLHVSKDYKYDLERIKYQFQENHPDLVVISHASNVFGIVSPIEKLFELAKKYSAVTVADLSQTAGLLNVDLGSELFDYAVFAGHKTLYAPTGISGFIMGNDTDLPPILFGGTGYDSANQDMPKSIPEKYEMGPLNISGIAGLNAALRWHDEITTDVIRKKEEENRNRLIEILKQHSFINLIAAETNNDYVGIVSCQIDGLSSDTAGTIFDQMGIAVRSGLQCAPLAHKFANTYPEGTIRFSVSYFTSESDFSELEHALCSIGEEL